MTVNETLRERVVRALSNVGWALLTGAAYAYAAPARAWGWLVREWRRAAMFLRVSAVSVRQCYRRLYRAQAEASEAPATVPGRDPTAPMTRREAIVYVQHLAIESLEGELAGIKKAGEAATEERDRKDAALVVEEGWNVVEALKRSNEVMMRDMARVKPATAADLKVVRGGR